MSATTDFLNQNIRPLCNTFFDANNHKYDLTEQSGCGKYTEALVKHLREQGFSKVGHLKKFGGATQYNGHAIDAFLYREGDDTLYRATDIIASAEAKPPYTPSHQPPSKGFGIDEPRYQDSDWMAEPGSGGGQPVPVNMVPWVGYFGDQSNSEFKRQLAYDYARRPQGADFDVSVWAFRVIYTALMGLLSPSQGGIPLGLTGAITHHTPEWCQALGVPIKKVPDGWNIGDPVP